MRHTLLIALLALLAGCAGSPPPADLPAPERLHVHGSLPQQATLSPAELESLGGEDVVWTFRDQQHTYRALRADRLLAHLGFDKGPGGATVRPGDRRPGWRNVVVARGADGFFAVFSIAELMPEMGPSRAFVAWQRDGAALPADEGPLRLVVVTDQKGSRSVRQLSELEVLDLRTLPR